MDFYFLAIQGSYSDLQVALFKNNICIEKIVQNAQKASSLLIPTIQTILENNFVSPNQLKFIAADQGPGAFTSLRVTISTLNGIAFASSIQLIGIDGLDALSEEIISNFNTNKKKPSFLVTLLNAYNNEVYFCINHIKQEKKVEKVKELKKFKGYKKIDSLLLEIKEYINNKNQEDKIILFGGNGTILHQSLILDLFNNAIINTENQVCSVEQIALTANKLIINETKRENIFQKKLYPLYLKSQTFAVRPGIK